LQKAVTLSGKANAIGALGYVYAVSGRKEEAQRVLEELREMSKRRYISAYTIAIVYAGLGEADPAFEWLSKAYEERAQSLIFLKVNPRLHSLRSDPRFADLVRRIGLPP